MSDNSQTIVDIGATPAQARRLAKNVVAHLVRAGVIQSATSDCTLGEPGHLPGAKASAATKGRRAIPKLRTIGMEVTTERRVFDTGGNGIELLCAACGASFEPGDEYMDAAEAWHGGDDDVMFGCPTCGQARRLVEWDGPWAMAMGNLGFTFWNWPELSDEFVREIQGILGHPVRVVRCHI